MNQAASARSAVVGIVKNLVQFREFVVVLFLIVLITTFSLSAENFDTITNARNILTNVSIVAVVGAGETLVVLTRRVDISVGSIVGLSGYACAYIISHDHGVPLIVAVLAAMGVGLGIGIINGILVAVCGIPAIIATLAMLGIGRGLDTVITGGQGIQTFQLPTSFVTFTSQNLPRVDCDRGRRAQRARSPFLAIRTRPLCNWLEPCSCKNHWYPRRPARLFGDGAIGNARRLGRVHLRGTV
jgi:rhamnose transport system permease protein